MLRLLRILGFYGAQMCGAGLWDSVALSFSAFRFLLVRV